MTFAIASLLASWVLSWSFSTQLTVGTVKLRELAFQSGIQMFFLHMSNEKHLVIRVSLAIILPSCVGIMINHYKDPYKTTSITVFHGK